MSVKATVPIMSGSQAAKLVDQAYQHLLERILSGDYSPGSVLSEVVVARELGLSRTPVHDALRQLANDGLVSQERNRRATVVAFTADDAFEIFEMRKLLEGAAAERAAGRMDERHLQPLREMADSLSKGLNEDAWVSRWAAFDEVFHSTIARCCANKLLEKDIARYRLMHRGLNLIFTDADTLQSALQEHIAILKALEARDGNAAQRLMVEHISHWQKFFIQHWSLCKHNTTARRSA